MLDASETWPYKSCYGAQAALERGLLPDDETLKQLLLDPELPIGGRDLGSLRWPEEPLRFVLIRAPLGLMLCRLAP